MYILKTHWYRNNWCVFLKFGKEDVMERVYIAIDLKSFYASVECVERESDPADIRDADRRWSRPPCGHPGRNEPLPSVRCHAGHGGGTAFPGIAPVLPRGAEAGHRASGLRSHFCPWGLQGAAQRGGRPCDDASRGGSWAGGVAHRALRRRPARL